jgi:hypothetical protein
MKTSKVNAMYAFPAKLAARTASSMSFVCSSLPPPPPTCVISSSYAIIRSSFLLPKRQLLSNRRTTPCGLLLPAHFL